MATPAPSWNTVRLYGRWHNLDGTLKAGRYTVTLPVRVTNAVDDVIVPAGTLTGTLQTDDPSAPSLDVQVPATDDPDNTPTGWQVTVTVTFTDGSAAERYVLDVPLAAAGTGINLRTVVLPQTIPAAQLVWLSNLAGLAFVNHGSNPNTARPTARTVIWAGTVEPVNANADYDLWVGPTAP